jgi:hypothetical protein
MANLCTCKPRYRYVDTKREGHERYVVILEDPIVLQDWLAPCSECGRPPTEELSPHA